MVVEWLDYAELVQCVGHDPVTGEVHKDKYVVWPGKQDTVELLSEDNDVADFRLGDGSYLFMVDKTLFRVV